MKIQMMKGLWRVYLGGAKVDGEAGERLESWSGDTVEGRRCSRSRKERDRVNMLRGDLARLEIWQ
jgi:hypothetical protein